MNQITRNLLGLKKRKEGLEEEISRIEEQIVTLIQPYWDALKETGLLHHSCYYPNNYKVDTVRVIGRRYHNIEKIECSYKIITFYFEYGHMGSYDWDTIQIPARWLDGNPEILSTRIKKWRGIFKAHKNRLEREKLQRKKEEEDKKEYIRLKRKFEDSPLSGKNERSQSASLT